MVKNLHHLCTLYCIYPFGGPAVPEYHTTLEHFIVDPPTSVHCKKYLQLLPWVSAVCRKKQNVSITNTTDFRVT